MLLFWRIRYLDTRDKDFKDRDLWLETDTLGPAQKGAVEATYELQDSNRRSMLRYRHLFWERPLEQSPVAFGGCFCIPDYFEDETGQELGWKRMAVVLTGNPDAVFFPPGTRPHDAEFSMADKPPVDLSQINLTPDQLDILGYFTRDLRELLASALYKDGPGSLSGFGDRWEIRTAVTDEEIRSFVTIFRRLYMENEPANFGKAASVFADALKGHPAATWAQATVAEYEAVMKQPVQTTPLMGPRSVSFTRKRLIDVFLYTRYAHQPDERRARQFNECLAAVGGNRQVLTWLFLTEIWKCSIEMRNAGQLITHFYDCDCQSRGPRHGVLGSLSADHPGFGTLEKKADREARVLREKAEELAIKLWDEAGRPVGGHAPWLDVALAQLKAATGRGTTG